MNVHVRFDYPDHSVTYTDVRWDAVPRVGDTLYIDDDQRPERVAGAFWEVVEVTWSLRFRTPTVRFRPQLEVIKSSVLLSERDFESLRSEFNKPRKDGEGRYIA